ncbi:DUF3099 domain-containing protein [Leucobacter tenebrionis]|uniref:DUF3099 domain-containing protein n=1 Tax=Leucobacter tenebrionis TaxID=2873270 RepID=UPI001CA73FCC|nr:DUF3099 domain-containing protein [Leucobacter tenebrionis]QZY52023.1 DUF3099 domain-containing protein [Leucobacter tenebrionis]
MAKNSGAAPSYSVTSAGVNPAEDRAHRMRMYFTAMSLRVVCVVSLFWLHGWWVLLAAAGAVLLPWFAVMVGNAVAHNGGEAPDAPQPLRIEGASSPEPGEAEDTLIVIDVEPERRAAPAHEAGTAAQEASDEQAGVADRDEPGTPGSPGGAA